MALTKHSTRTLRKPCKACGAVDLYWAHDTERPGRQHCAEHDTSGAYVLIERDGTAHAARCEARRAAHNNRTVPTSPVTEPTEPTAKDDIVPVVPESTASAAPVAGPNAAAAQAMAALMAAMTPTIDRDTVSQIVKDELQSIIFPTSVVVVRDGADPVKIDGLVHSVVPRVLRYVAAGCHVMMVGQAGTGKSTIAEQVAKALGLPFASLSLSPQTPTSALFGYMNATGDYVRTLFREIFENGGVFNFDEMDNGHPAILASINGALANGHAAFPDGMVTRSPRFIAVSSANTYGRGADRKYVGRQALDAATLDRYAVINVDVDESLERELVFATGIDRDAAIEILAYVRRCRANAERAAMPIVVSPRASIGIAKVMRDGEPAKDAIDAYVRRGLSDQDWAKVADGAIVPANLATVSA